MKKHLSFILYFIITVPSIAQEKIPFIDFDELVKKIAETSQSDNHEKTIEILESINKNDSIYPATLVYKSYYLLNNKKYQKAIEATNEGLKLKNYDNEASFFINKSLAYVYLEEYEKALEVIDKALKVYPNSHILWHNKGVALEKAKMIKDAAEAYKKAITLNPIFAKSHLQLGNICYKQNLMSQALMCFNIYLLLTTDEKGAFNTLKTLNNIIAQKNEHEPDLNLEISLDDENFEDIDLVLSNKIALNKGYKTGNKINISLTKQNHALLAQLKNFEGNGGFWDKKYVPLFNWIVKNDLFNDFIYTLCYSIENKEYAKIIKQNENKIVEFMSLFYNKWQDILKTNTVLFDGKQQDVTYYYYDNYVQAIGKMENDNSIGKWMFYNENGQLSSYGIYNDKGERTGKWTWLHNNGNVKETAIYENNTLQGKNLKYHRNGKPNVIGNYKNNAYDGEYMHYNDKGALMQKKYFKNGELNGTYKSFFDVGEQLVEFNILYKDGAIENSITEYYADGSVYLEAPFINGKKQGLVKKYYSNKNVLSEINYHNGQLNGTYKSYYPNSNVYETGQSVDNFYDGPWKQYYKDGTLKIDFNYDKGYTDGIYKYYDTDEKIYYTYLYKKGQIIEYKYFDKKGEILSQGKRKKGKFQFKGHYPNGNISSRGLYNIKGGKDGLWEFYSKNGIITEKGEYSNNKAIGEHINYYNNGEIQSKLNFKNDSLHGYYTSYYKNGQLEQQGWYKDNLAKGEWRTYYIDGVIKAITFYHKDKNHGIQKHYSVDGKLYYTSKYEHGELLSEVYYDSRENITQELNYKPDEINYLIERFYNNGKPKYKIEYVNGVKHGKYTRYNFYGNKTIDGNYLNGNQDGKWITYHDNGQIENIRYYSNANLHGKGKDYYKNGNTEREFIYEYGDAVGQWINYHKNGKKDTTTEYDSNNIHGRKVFFDDNENVQLIRFYNHGSLIGYSYLDKESKELPMIPIENETSEIKSYYNNGNLARELEYKNGELVNTYNEYFYSGQLQTTMSYQADEYNGLTTEFYANGNTKATKTYQYGKLQGVIKTYFENGKIKEEHNYQNDARIGESSFYNEKGKLIKTETYFNGNIFNTKTY